MAKFFKSASILVVMIWLISSACMTYVEPDEIGVRRSLLGGILPSAWSAASRLLSLSVSFYL